MQGSSCDAVFDNDGTLIGHIAIDQSHDGERIFAYDQDFNYVGSAGHPGKAIELLHFQRSRTEITSQPQTPARSPLLRQRF